MKRAGFTMIELIFVIVILGILASVAVPKLIGVKASAEEGLVKGFTGTLNRTVGASKWSQSLMDDNNGSILSSLDATYAISTSDTEFPTGITAPLNTTNCVNAGVLPVALNTGTFIIYCLDGNASNSPKFFYADSTTTPTAAMMTTAITNGSLKMK